MPVYNGNSKAKDLYYGGVKIKEAYYNGNKVYDSIKPLYYCYSANGLYIYFPNELKITGTLTGYYYGLGMAKVNTSSQLNYNRQMTVNAIYNGYVNMTITSTVRTYDWYRSDDLYT